MTYPLHRTTMARYKKQHSEPTIVCNQPSSKEDFITSLRFLGEPELAHPSGHQVSRDLGLALERTQAFYQVGSHYSEWLTSVSFVRDFIRKAGSIYIYQ